MSWFSTKTATTAEQEDPKGTKKFHFSFGTMTRSQLQQVMEDILIEKSRLGVPLSGAEEIVTMFAKPEDQKILAESPTIQGVVFGDGRQDGPVMYFLKKAVEQQDSAGKADVRTVERFRTVKEGYEKLLLKAEEAKVLLEDPKGTKTYAFSFGTMTGSQLQQKMEDTLTQYSEAGLMQAGAERVMDMFASPQDSKLLRESPKIQSVVLGGSNGTGPVDYFLEQAQAQLATSGSDDKAPALKLEQLQKRYGKMRDDVLGAKRDTASKGGDKFELRIFRGDEDQLGR